MATAGFSVTASPAGGTAVANFAVTVSNTPGSATANFTVSATTPPTYLQMYVNGALQTVQLGRFNGTSIDWLSPNL